MHANSGILGQLDASNSAYDFKIFRVVLLYGICVIDVGSEL